MSVIGTIEIGGNIRWQGPLQEDIREKCKEVVRMLAFRIKHYAAQNALRAANLDIFEADILFVVRGTGVFYFVFAVSEYPGEQITYEDWEFEDIPSLEYIVNCMTFDGGHAVFSFIATEDELTGFNMWQMIDELAKNYIEPIVQSRMRVSAPTPSEENEIKSVELSKRIFIVHGHDEGMRESVARVLSKLGLEPVILHEQPDNGKTIIEKFASYSDVGYAVVVLSPDDMAYQKGQSPKAAKSRARQNVIFELGYFIGKLGRNRVAALYKMDTDFEWPSDYAGVLYIPYKDATGDWRFKLVRELRAQDYPVSADVLL